MQRLSFHLWNSRYPLSMISRSRGAQNGSVNIKPRVLQRSGRRTKREWRLLVFKLRRQNHNACSYVSDIGAWMWLAEEGHNYRIMGFYHILQAFTSYLLSASASCLRLQYRGPCNSKIEFLGHGCAKHMGPLICIAEQPMNSTADQVRRIEWQAAKYYRVPKTGNSESPAESELGPSYSFFLFSTSPIPQHLCKHGL